MKKYICPELVCVGLATADIVTVSVGEKGNALTLDLDDLGLSNNINSYSMLR